MICKYCGKEIEDERATCCPHCFKYTELGESALMRLANMKPPSKITKSPAFGYADAGNHTAVNTCKQCGKALRPGQEVCPDCGTQTEASKKAQKENATARARANVQATYSFSSELKCWNCKKPLPSLTSTCPHCGAQPIHPTSTYTASKAGDAPSAGYAILGFLIPIVGLILFLVWKQDYPQRAKSAGTGALIAVLLEVIVALIGVSCVACTVCSLLGNTAYVPPAVGL